MYELKDNLALLHIAEQLTQKEQSYELCKAHFDIPGFNSLKYGKHSTRHKIST